MVQSFPDPDEPSGFQKGLGSGPHLLPEEFGQAGTGQSAEPSQIVQAERSIHLLAQNFHSPVDTGIPPDLAVKRIGRIAVEKNAFQ